MTTQSNDEILDELLEDGHIGESIRVARRRCDLNQQQLAELMGCQRSYISDVEQNRTQLSTEQAIKFATVLGGPKKYWAALALESAQKARGHNFRVECIDLAENVVVETEPQSLIP